MPGQGIIANAATAPPAKHDVDSRHSKLPQPRRPEPPNTRTGEVGWGQRGAAAAAAAVKDTVRRR